MAQTFISEPAPEAPYLRDRRCGENGSKREAQNFLVWRNYLPAQIPRSFRG